MARRRCPICRTPHHRLGRMRAMAALRVAPGRLAGALRSVIVAWDQDRWAEHDLNHLDQIRNTFAALRSRK